MNSMIFFSAGKITFWGKSSSFTEIITLPFISMSENKTEQLEQHKKKF